MAATFINAGLILLGSLLGLLCKRFIKQRLASAVTGALALVVLGIGAASAVGTQNTLCVVVCTVLGTLLGEWIDIEKRLDGAGELIRRKLMRGEGESRFTEGFVSASVLYCVGAMAIMGSLEAGINGNYSILISKGVIDGVTSVTLAATLGVGVAFSVLPLIVYQGALTLLAAAVGPLLPEAVICEMSAVGGIIIMGIAVNMLGLTKERLRVGNLLPAIFLPVAYLPLADFLATLF